MSVHNGLLDVAWFCVYKLGGLLAGDDFKLGGGGCCKCDCVGRQKCLYECCLILPLSFLATVFQSASVFNGDLSHWDVAKVTNMFNSKSIRKLKNDFESSSFWVQDFFMRFPCFWDHYEISALKTFDEISFFFASQFSYGMSFPTFCCTIFSRDFLTRINFGRYEIGL